MSQYGVIYADPPWKYKMYSDKGHEKSPQKHYQCMTQKELLAMREKILWATAPNSILVIWTTFAAGNIGGETVDFIADALELIRAWGFQRVTGGPWIKRTAGGKCTFGTGYIMRGAAELFLIGTHGNPRVKNRSTRNLLLTGDWPKGLGDIDSIIIDALRREHSRKPDEMIAVVEALFDGPYLEVFARTRRPGWDAWGNETDKFSGAVG